MEGYCSWVEERKLSFTIIYFDKREDVFLSGKLKICYLFFEGLIFIIIVESF